MANRIKNYQYSEEESFKMSNGWTQNFYEVLLLSASELAKTNWEKDFAIWIAQHDSTVIGSGMGFDIVEIPWTKENFENEKAFLLKVIQQEKEKTGWRTAEYTADYKVMLNFLHLFQKMIKHFTVEMIDYEKQDIVLETTHESNKPYKYQQCPIHKVYLHGYSENFEKNCLICNAQKYDSYEDYLKDIRENKEYKESFEAAKPWTFWSVFGLIFFTILLIPNLLFKSLKKILNK